MLKGKRIWVGGGCGLIGSAIARACRESGAEVVTVDINEKADVVADLVKVEFKEFFDNQGIDGWVNASYPRDPVDHFLVTHNVSIEVIQIMLKNQIQGSLVHISSIYGINAPLAIYRDTNIDWPTTHYTFVKAGTIGFTKYIAATCGPKNIRVNCVCPGGVQDSQGDLFVKRYSSVTPLRRMATPEEIAWPVVFLLSDKASYITGHNLVIDGGRTIW